MLGLCPFCSWCRSEEKGGWGAAKGGNSIWHSPWPPDHPPPAGSLPPLLPLPACPTTSSPGPVGTAETGGGCRAATSCGSAPKMAAGSAGLPVGSPFMRAGAFSAAISPPPQTPQSFLGWHRQLLGLSRPFISLTVTGGQKLACRVGGGSDLSLTCLRPVASLPLLSTTVEIKLGVQALTGNVLCRAKKNYP